MQAPWVSRCSRCAFLAAALPLALGAACAHSPAQPAAPETSEVAALRERVRRLEKRLSDVDAQVALLTERIASTQDAVSLGSARPVVVRTTSMPRPAPPLHTYEDDTSRSIDLDTAPYSSSASSVQAFDLSPPKEAPPPIDEESDERDPEPSAFAPSDGPPDDVKGAYDWAHARMRERRYLEAIAAFEGIVERYPAHDLADNALYWTAVCHERRGEPKLAIDGYRKLPMRYPTSAKMPDALYGMAVAHEALGEPVLAETLYAQLVQEYPKAERVPDARRALRRLGGE